MNKKLGLLVLAFFVTLVGGCAKVSDEKVEEAQAIYAQLVERHNEVIDLYASANDESYSKKLNEMSDKINAIGKKELANFAEADIDAIIDDLQSNITSYDEIEVEIERLIGKEKKTIGIPVTIRNNTSINLHELFLYEVGAQGERKNLVENMEYLGGYDTFNVVQLYLSGEGKIVMLEAMDEDGNNIIKGEIDMSEVDQDGIIIDLQFSFEAMEGQIEIEK